MQIPIIDTHAHMDVRSANDYEMMAISGVKTIVVPSTYTGLKKKSKQEYTHYYDRIIDFERRRAEAFGINLYAAIAIDPEDVSDQSVALETIECLPDYFHNDYVCAVGEVGLEKFTETEVICFRKQLQIANKHHMPVIMHTPHHDKARNLPRMLSILKDIINEYCIDRNLLLLDDLDAQTLEIGLELQLGAYGIAVSPILNSLYVLHNKTTPNEIITLIEKHGCNKIIFNTALAWGFGDAMAISKVILHLKMKGISEDCLYKLAYGNANRFLSQCKNYTE